MPHQEPPTGEVAESSFPQQTPCHSGGQGKKDTWQHFRGLPDASSSRNLERMHFRTSPE
ncbi:hypothetical protein CK203_004599 [Vitis vinifera]|uniref:Uncharacterized protein n=1 Tax=Vitis vinifera TaxID=29760 RepID=A0A438KGU3_VITVI|nr:hypothetical protein CK203_004599 [Vitis vinifera]